MYNFIGGIVHADDLTPLGAGTFAGPKMTMFGPRVYTGPVSVGSTGIPTKGHLLLFVWYPLSVEQHGFRIRLNGDNQADYDSR